MYMTLLFHPFLYLEVYPFFLPYLRCGKTFNVTTLRSQNHLSPALNHLLAVVNAAPAASEVAAAALHDPRKMASVADITYSAVDT
jgi:hypothetical protein